jgi:hypothetical protein
VIKTREVGVLIHSLAGALGDVVSAAEGYTLRSLGYVLGVEVEELDPPQHDWWRRFEIISVTNPVVEHETLLSFITTSSLRGLTRSGGNPVRTLELLFAILDEAEDEELAGRIRRHLKKHGITRDSVEVAAAKDLRKKRGRPLQPDKGTSVPLARGQKPEYLAARLARDHGDLAAEVQAGRMSLRTAAKEAGIVKARDPLRELKRWWDRASDCDRAQFEGFIDAWHREREDAA